MRDLLEATVLASAVARRSVPVAEQPVRQVGRQLFEALFTGPVYGMYRASMGVAQQRGKRLRVVLRLTAPELAALPWEMLFDPETETYLCRQEPLVRHVHAPYTAEPLEVRPPLRILGLVASPRGLSPLDVDAEKGYLTEALAGPVADGLVELDWVPEATWQGFTPGCSPGSGMCCISSDMATTTPLPTRGSSPWSAATAGPTWSRPAGWPTCWARRSPLPGWWC